MISTGYFIHLLLVETGSFLDGPTYRDLVVNLPFLAHFHTTESFISSKEKE